MHLVGFDGGIVTWSEIVVVGGGLLLNILFVRSDIICHVEPRENIFHEIISRLENK